MKLIFSCTLFLLFTQIIAQIPTNGLQVSYPFTNGSTNDFSLNNNHLTAFNGPTPCPDRFNNPNCAYLLDGTDDFFVALNPGPKYKKSRSLTFWAKTTATFNSNGYTVLHYGNPTVGGGRFEVGLNSGCNGLYADYGFGYMTKSYNTTDNIWHMYTIVYDSTVSNQIGSVLYYVDANLIGTACMSYNTTQSVNTQTLDPITIGKFYNALPRYFNGAIDDIHIYDRPLSPTEILTIYNTLPCAGPPNSPSVISGNQTICFGSSWNYSIAPVTSATSYSWTLPAGWQGSSTNTLINVTSNGNSGTIFVKAINSCGQSSVTSINITVNPSPTVGIVSTKSIICNGNSIVLIANGAVSYTWSNNSNNQSVSVTPTTTTTYTVIGSNSFGCSQSAIKTISVTNFPLPTINVTGPGSSCPGQTINLASNGAQTYTWQPGNLNGFLVVVSPTITTTFTITGTDVNDCYNSTVYSHTVLDCGSGAGINNHTAIKSTIRLIPNPSNIEIEIFGIIAKKVSIYNSLGELVLTKELINNQIINVENLANGVYLVNIQSENQLFQTKLLKF